MQTSKVSLILLSTICIAFSASSQSEYLEFSSFRMRGAKGKLISFLELFYNATKTGEPDGDQKMETTYFFDTDGKLIKEEAEVPSSTERYYLYDDSNRLKAVRRSLETDYSYDEHYVYNRAGAYLVRTNTNSKKSAKSFLFDRAGNTIEIRLADGNLNDSWKFEYDSKSRLISETAFDDRTTFEYNSYGDVIRQTTKNLKQPDSGSMSVYKYTYDSNGNWLTKFRINTYASGREYYTLYKRTYQYR